MSESKAENGDRPRPASAILRHEALNPPGALNEQASNGWWLAMCRVQFLIDTGVLHVSSSPEAGVQQ